MLKIHTSCMDTRNYDKIKNLVELNDDILAVFIVEFFEIKDSFLAENFKVDNNYIDSIYKEIKNIVHNRAYYENSRIVGPLKWSMFEFNKIRILKIYEGDITIIILIKSNTQLEYNVDNILGYYYEEEEEPKSLF